MCEESSRTVTQSGRLSERKPSRRLSQSISPPECRQPTTFGIEVRGLIEVEGSANRQLEAVDRRITAIRS